MIPIRFKAVVSFGVLAIAGCLSAPAAQTETFPVEMQASPTNDSMQVGLTWTSDADTFYEIYSTTNLASGSWELAVAEPLSSTNLLGQMQLMSADATRFFQVRKLDTQGPAIADRSPGPSVAGVSRTAPLSISLSDATGVDTNSFRLTIDGTTVLTSSSPGATASATQFIYDPVAVPWGDFGGTVSVSFACADIKGNSTYAEWSFSLEIPVTLADNILVLGGPPAPASGPEALSSQLASTSVEIVAVYADRVVLSYSGESHGIVLGMLLANGDVAKVFYRRVTGIVDNPSTHQVTVYTEDVPFTELITEGSFDSSQFVWTGVGGVEPMGVSPLAVFEKDIPYSHADSFAVNTDWGPVSFSGTAGYDLDGKFEFSTEVINLKVTQLSAGVDANLDVALNGRLVFDGTTAPVNKTIGLCGDGIQIGTATAWIYGVPVTVSLWFDMELCVEAESSGAMTLDAGATANANFSYDISYSPATQWKQTGDGDFTYTLPPVVVSGGVDAEAYVYVRPSITARLYEAVGIEMDYRRGPYVTAQMLAGDGRCQLGLYDKRSVNLAVWMTDLPPFLDGLIDTENLPSWPLWSAETPVRVWYYPEVSEYTRPTFTLNPSGGTYASGASVTLQSSASGKPAPAYQWYQNGNKLTGKTAATLGLTMGASAVGTYHCTAVNSMGTATSQSAAIGLPASAPTGMALIPAGSFQMGNAMDPNEGWDAELPVHTVYVSAFYMDKTEVTKAKWDEVYAWAVTHGYSFDNAGSGKASNHPVHSINWYDMVKWCNARSQKEGKTPAYYTSSNKITANLYKTGWVDLQNDWVRWDSGYRLPTEAEWEKAARGGLSGKRFPWGDVIDHTRANYYGYADYSYDQGYEGFDTRYVIGDYPFTSPVGSFAANGYGLYDMAGNLWEWCWDLFDYCQPSGATNPRGPSSGSRRVLRGGSWYYDASGCRAAIRIIFTPRLASSGVGFRAVLPPGQ